jgi:hypothetical protein
MRLARLCVIATPDALDSGGVLGSPYLARGPLHGGVADGDFSLSLLCGLDSGEQ